MFEGNSSAERALEHLGKTVNSVQEHATHIRRRKTPRFAQLDSSWDRRQGGRAPWRRPRTLPRQLQLGQGQHCRDGPLERKGSSAHWEKHPSQSSFRSSRSSLEVGRGEQLQSTARCLGSSVGEARVRQPKQVEDQLKPGDSQLDKKTHTINRELSGPSLSTLGFFE